MILGLVLFIGTHMFATLRGARAAVIQSIGERPYKGAIAVLSIIGVLLIGFGFGEYRRSGWVNLWHPPHWTYYATQLLMWPASIFVVAAYIRGNIWRTLKHPMLVGIKTWAAAHLISNGDLGSIILFGSFLLWAAYDRVSLKRRADAGAPAIPANGRRNDMIAIVVGTLLYMLLGLVFHPLVIGRAVFGRAAF